MVSDGVLAQVHFIVGLVGPLGPWPHPVVMFLVPEYIINGKRHIQ